MGISEYLHFTSIAMSIKMFLLLILADTGNSDDSLCDPFSEIETTDDEYHPPNTSSTDTSSGVSDLDEMATTTERNVEKSKGKLLLSFIGMILSLP